MAAHVQVSADFLQLQTHHYHQNLIRMRDSGQISPSRYQELVESETHNGFALDPLDRSLLVSKGNGLGPGGLVLGERFRVTAIEAEAGMLTAGHTHAIVDGLVRAFPSQADLALAASYRKYGVPTNFLLSELPGGAQPASHIYNGYVSSMAPNHGLYPTDAPEYFETERNPSVRIVDYDRDNLRWVRFVEESAGGGAIQAAAEPAVTSPFGLPGVPFEVAARGSGFPRPKSFPP